MPDFAPGHPALEGLSKKKKKKPPPSVIAKHYNMSFDPGVPPKVVVRATEQVLKLPVDIRRQLRAKNMSIHLTTSDLAGMYKKSGGTRKTFNQAHPGAGPLKRPPKYADNMANNSCVARQPGPQSPAFAPHGSTPR